MTESIVPEAHSIVTLHLILLADRFPLFSLLLQQGFRVKIQAGTPVKGVLCEQFGLSPEYVQDRIKTILLDGKAVDDMDGAILKDGSTLALSGPMPGLAGASLRRDGLLASFRAQITHRGDRMDFPPGAEGMITVKIFNLLLDEIGPVFLQRGIYLRKRDFQDFCKSLPEKFQKEFRAAGVNSQKSDLEDLQKMDWLRKNDMVFLSVDFAGPSLKRAI
ncbi:MAG: hypothetical protein ABSB32_14185 [Thermodesulfobacteriota bacterium]